MYNQGKNIMIKMIGKGIRFILLGEKYMQQELCVIIHGFTGNPFEVKPLADALEQAGYEVITPLLPGHTENNERMENIAAAEWLQMVEEIVKQAVKENKKIHMMGFSMGAMIASIMAYRIKLSTLVLLSPAVYVVTPNLLKIRLENLFQSKKGNRSPEYQTMCKSPYILRSTSIYNLWQFQKVVRQARGIFHHLSVPLCIIHGQRDETADPNSAKFIYHAASSKDKELHYLPGSKHHICLDCEANTVIQIVLTFLKKYH